MDEIVRQAMAKWPNVPHCYGWLALDARGNWRMRDERCQAQGLRGDMIRNATLLSFINRNYLSDEANRWYFQNGPQRVYVDLEIAPWICRSDPRHEFILHTGQAMPTPRSAVLTREGDLAFALETACAVVDDRDLATCLPRLTLAGKPFDEDALAAWGEDANPGPAVYEWNGQSIPLIRRDRADLSQDFGFNPQPRAEKSS